MNNEVLHLQVNNTICICEAVGCFERATTKTKVKVGNLGSISLDLCTNCVGKFEENDDITGNIDIQQKIAGNEEDQRR
jgi:hypothetical protein